MSALPSIPGNISWALSLFTAPLKFESKQSKEVLKFRNVYSDSTDDPSPQEWATSHDCSTNETSNMLRLSAQNSQTYKSFCYQTMAGHLAAEFGFKDNSHPRNHLLCITSHCNLGKGESANFRMSFFPNLMGDNTPLELFSQQRLNQFLIRRKFRKERRLFN